MTKKSTRLANIRAKLKKETTLDDAGNFWRPKQGANTIRLLPGVGEMDDAFWSTVGTHYIQQTGGKWKAWVCPSFTADESCPICELVTELNATGNKNDRNMAGEIRVSRGYAVNIIDREHEDKGPQVYTAPKTVMAQISALVGDDEYGDDIIDPDEGLDLTITRSGQGRQTSYDVTPRRKTSPLSDDPDQIDKWLDMAIDLTPIWLTDDPEEDATAYRDEQGAPIAIFGIMPYERIKREFEGVDEEEEEDVPEEEGGEEEEEEATDDEYSNVRKAISKRRAGRTDEPAVRAPRRRRSR